MTTFAKPLRVAVVGTGYFSQFHYAAWQRMPDVELVALVALDKKQGKAFQQQYDIAHCFSDVSDLLQYGHIDLIDAVTPPQSHRAIIDQCIANRTALMCQKPFCESVAQAEQVVTRIEQQNAFVVVHENFRFQPWYQEIKKIIATKQLGTLYEISFDLRPGDGQGPQAYLDRQPYFQTQKRFLIQETGVHFVDVFRFLFGDVTGLFARLTRLNPVMSGEDAGVVTMEFKNGARGVFNGNRLADHSARNARLTMGELRIEGSAASLYLNGDGQIHLRTHGEHELTEHLYDWTDNDFGGDCVFNTNRHVADHLLYGKPVQNLARDYLVNRKIEQAIYESADAATWVQLD